MFSSNNSNTSEAHLGVAPSEPLHLERRALLMASVHHCSEENKAHIIQVQILSRLQNLVRKISGDLHVIIRENLL